MLYREIARILGYYLLLLAAAFVFPLSIAVYYEFFAQATAHPQVHTTHDFIFALMLCLGCAIACFIMGKDAAGHFYRREGIASVVFIWILTPALSALPFITSGTLNNPLQAYFEMASGFTTTGSTVLHAKSYNLEGEEIPIVRMIPGVIDTTYIFYGNVEPIRDLMTGHVVKDGVEAVGKALLFWRSLSQWIGGVGVVVLFVAILPTLGVGGKVLFQSEIAGPMKESTTPRIKESAKQLWQIYLCLTIIEVVILLFVNPALPLFEAVVIAFSTLSTGGFSTQNNSIAGYHHVGMEWVIILFMIAGSVNFSLYYHIFKGRLNRLIEPETLLFFSFILILSLFTVYAIHGAIQIPILGVGSSTFDWLDSFRYGTFHLVSGLTSTGFVTTNYNAWPYAAQIILIIAMFLGGMCGSTAGGIKTMRIYLLFRIAQNRVECLFRPHHMKLLKVGEREIDYTATNGVLCYFLIVVTLAVLGTFFYVWDGMDLETAFGLTTCMLNNSGMGFRMANPDYSCAFLSNASLIISSFLMICGRLEYFVLLAMLTPVFWRNHS